MFSCAWLDGVKKVIRNKMRLRKGGSSVDGGDDRRHGNLEQARDGTVGSVTKTHLIVTCKSIRCYKRDDELNISVIYL